MDTERLGVVISLMALSVALVGAVMSRRALRRASYRASSDLVLETDRLFLQWPELRPYFYHRVPCPPPAHPLHGRVMAAAEFYLDALETIWDHRDEFAVHDRAAWREWIHDMFESSPAIQTLYARSPGWYPTLAALLDWDGCSTPGEHPWTCALPGPSGSGWWFRSRRVLRHLPLVGGYVRR